MNISSTKGLGSDCIGLAKEASKDLSDRFGKDLYDVFGVVQYGPSQGSSKDFFTKGGHWFVLMKDKIGGQLILDPCFNVIESLEESGYMIHDQPYRFPGDNKNEMTFKKLSMRRNQGILQVGGGSCLCIGYEETLGKIVSVGFGKKSNKSVSMLVQLLSVDGSSQWYDLDDIDLVYTNRKEKEFLYGLSVIRKQKQEKLEFSHGDNLTARLKLLFQNYGK